MGNPDSKIGLTNDWVNARIPLQYRGREMNRCSNKESIWKERQTDRKRQEVIVQCIETGREA